MDAAIIGAVSALAGVALSQGASMIQGVLERKNKQASLMREKLEELADNLHQTIHYADSLLKTLPVRGRSQPKGTLQAVSLSAEARRVYVLSLLYFPSLKEESSKLVKSLTILYSAAMVYDGIDEKGLKQAVVDFSSSRKSLDDLITIEAKNVT